MQEEVENRVVNLAISTTRLTARTIVNAAMKGLQKLRNKDRTPVGKQSLKQLIGRKQGVSTIDISKTDLKGFEKYARKYHIDYAITKDKSVEPPKYLVFFKAGDAEAMSAAFKAYSAEVMNRSKKPSVRKTLHKLMDAVKDLPVKVANRDKQREQSR